MDPVLARRLFAAGVPTIRLRNVPPIIRSLTPATGNESYQVENQGCCRAPSNNVWNESHRPDPLLPLHLVRNPIVYTANLRALLVSGVFLAALVLIALDDEQVLRHSPIRAGLSILPAALTILALGRLGPKLVGKLGIRWTALFAPLLLAAGMFWFALAPADSFMLSRFAPDLFIGFGATLANLANMLSATSAASPSERGAISGLQYTAQQTGQSSALAALTAVVATYTASVIASRPALSPLTALHNGYQFAFFVAGVAAVVSAALALPARRSRGLDERA